MSIPNTVPRLCGLGETMLQALQECTNMAVEFNFSHIEYEL